MNMIEEKRRCLLDADISHITMVLTNMLGGKRKSSLLLVTILTIGCLNFKQRINSESLAGDYYYHILLAVKFIIFQN